MGILIIKKIKSLSLIFILVILILLFIWKPIRKEGFLRIPLIFSSQKREPRISINVNSDPQLILLDTGSCEFFSLKKELIEAIKDKKFTKNKSWYDIKGDEHINEEYEVMKSIDIEKKIKFRRILIRLNEWSDGPLIHCSSEYVEDDQKNWQETSGVAGARLIRSLPSCLIDFSKSSLFAIRDLKKFKKKTGYSFKDFTEISLEKNDPHIVINIETDFGAKKFALDTGASNTVLNLPSDELHAHETVTSERFVIGTKDFGETELYLFPIPTKLEVDAILGRDFFEKHVIYLDFVNNKALIGPTIPSPSA